MIAAWMLYCVTVGTAFVIVGHGLERALDWAGRPTRWSWSVALAGTLLLPVAALAVPGPFRTVAVPVAEWAIERPASGAVVPAAMATPVAAPSSGHAFGAGDVDRLLVWGWGVTSAGLLLLLAVGAVRLAALRRRWAPAVVDGRSVFLSDGAGPAVTGLWTPRVVIPRWALDLPAHRRRLILWHEEEHVRAGDPWLLAVGGLALVLAPWNPALWWQARRLRLAVEMDCDARVLARSGRRAASEYAGLLLEVGRRRAAAPLGAAALGEPASFLGRRIDRMAAVLPRWRWAGVAAALAVAAAALVAACEAPRPVAPHDAADPASPVASASQGDPLERVAEEVRRQWPWVLDDRRILWLYFVVDSRDSLVQSGVAVVTPELEHTLVREQVQGALRGGGIDALDPVARLAARRLVPGFDALDVARVTLFGKGARTATGEMAAGQHVVLWVRVRDSRVPARGLDGRIVYPELLRRAGIQGVVILEAGIDASGLVQPGSVQVISSPHPALSHAAVNAIRGAVFPPAPPVEGRLVEVRARIPVRFALGR